MMSVVYYRDATFTLKYMIPSKQILVQSYRKSIDLSHFVSMLHLHILENRKRNDF